MTTLPFDITPRALDEARAIMARKAVPEGYALRVGVRGGAGCHGVNYIIGFDRPADGDAQTDLDGLPVIYEKRQALYLAGVRVEYIDEPDRRGFTFVKE